MINKDEFRKYATKHMNMSGMHLDKYMQMSAPNIVDFTPAVIEERQLNIAQMDVFSRLMMDIHGSTCDGLCFQCNTSTIVIPRVN
jgi:ATP-dependent Clp protease, protease subunit